MVAAVGGVGVEGDQQTSSNIKEKLTKSLLATSGGILSKEKAMAESCLRSSQATPCCQAQRFRRDPKFGALQLRDTFCLPFFKEQGGRTHENTHPTQPQNHTKSFITGWCQLTNLWKGLDHQLDNHS